MHKIESACKKERVVTDYLQYIGLLRIGNGVFNIEAAFIVYIKVYATSVTSVKM